MITLEFFTLLFLSTVRLSVPLLFAAMGGLISERSGVIQLALEGFILVGAFTAASVTYFTKSAWLGWFAAFFAGMLWAQIYCLFVLKFKSDQIVSGTALNLLAFGLIPCASKILFNSTGSTPGLDIEMRFTFQAWLVGLIVFIGLSYVYYKTLLGLRLQFAGEKPEALESAGLSVIAYRWFFVSLAGGIAAWGGSSLSLWLASSYSPMMSAGRGYMALAAVIFGRWKPLPTLGACLFFALTEAIQFQMQGNSSITQWVPVALIQILPYVVTILFLAGFIKSASPPQALGK